MEIRKQRDQSLRMKIWNADVDIPEVSIETGFRDSKATYWKAKP